MTMTVNGVGNATDCKRSDSIGGNKIGRAHV